MVVPLTLVVLKHYLRLLHVMSHYRSCNLDLGFTYHVPFKLSFSTSQLLLQHTKECIRESWYQLPNILWPQDAYQHPVAVHVSVPNLFIHYINTSIFWSISHSALQLNTVHCWAPFGQSIDCPQFSAVVYNATPFFCRIWCFLFCLGKSWCLLGVLHLFTQSSQWQPQFNCWCTGSFL